MQIRRIAEESDVPVISDPPLARALHGSVEIGQVIPEELYAAVARVLAFVYRLAGRARRAGGIRPTGVTALPASTPTPGRLAS
jgi:flagellar biosynthetic protein FlhB